MRTIALAAILTSGVLISLSGQAQAAGCVSGAVVGGVAGHVAGHHGLLGAAAGCAIGHHERVRRERDEAAQDRMERQGPERQMYGRDAYRDDERRSN